MSEHQNIPRRAALKTLGLATMTIVLSATGVVTYRAATNGVLTSGAGTPYDAWDRWADDPGLVGVATAGLLAANPHNTQPWTFRVQERAVELHGDVTRQMPFTDPLLREHHVGLGCALENMVLAADARRLRNVVDLLPDPARPSLVARLRLDDDAGAVRESILHAFVPQRHSNRGPYTPEAITTAQLEHLTEDTDALAPAGVRWITSAPARAALSALILDATAAVVADSGQSVEGFSWFRNDRSDIDAYGDGLTLDGQGLAPATLAAAKLLPASSRAAGDAFWLEQTRLVHTATATVYGIVTVPDPDDPADRIRGGRLLQHLHLAATAAGLGLQHMNQVTERIDADRSRSRAPVFAQRWEEILGSGPHAGLVAFRLGHPVRPALRSPRRPLASVLG